MQPGVIRVALVDDQQLFRRGLTLLLDQEDDIEVVGEAATAAEAIETLVDLAPDVLLLDIELPDMSGIELAAKAHEDCPNTRILMLTMSDDEGDLFAAVKAGAVGYLEKSASTQEVAEAVRAVHGGQSLINPEMARRLLEEFRHLDEVGTAAELTRTQLTQRELDVLRLMAQGRNNRELGEELSISENTVKNHVRNLLEKFHARSRMEIVIAAVREGLVDLP